MLSYSEKLLNVFELVLEKCEVFQNCQNLGAIGQIPYEF